MTVDTLPLSPVQSHAPILWELVGSFKPGMPPQQIRIDSRRFRVGRRPDLDLPIPSMMVSTNHAEFIQVGMVLFIRDVNSTNGTFVNGRRITNRDVPLKDGDRLRFGNVELLVRRSRLGEQAVDTTILTDTAKEFRLSRKPASDEGSLMMSADPPRRTPPDALGAPTDSI